jgi:hypothetical protein
VTTHAEYTGDKVDQASIKEEFRDRTGPVGRELDRLQQLVLDQARRLVRVRSGTLIASIRPESGIGPLGQYRDVVAGVPGLTTYLGYEHDGTEPHMIYPSRRKYLRFIQNGQVRFARKVHHPGTKGSYFLTRALDVLK